MLEKSAFLPARSQFECIKIEVCCCRPRPQPRRTQGVDVEKHAIEPNPPEKWARPENGKKPGRREDDRVRKASGSRAIEQSQIDPQMLFSTDFTASRRRISSYESKPIRERGDTAVTGGRTDEVGVEPRRMERCSETYSGRTDPIPRSAGRVPMGESKRLERFSGFLRFHERRLITRNPGACESLPGSCGRRTGSACRGRRCRRRRPGRGTS